MAKIAIIIPAYNEEKSIKAVVDGILELNNNSIHVFIPVVVNDCSTDHTLEVITKINCIVLNLPINLGIGGAVQTGHKYALEKDFDYAIQVDGDGQHPPIEIPKLLEAIINSNADVVIGSRFIENKGFQSSAMRRAGINYFVALLKLLCGIRVKDPTSGLRIFNPRAIEIICDYYPDEYPEPEALVLFKYHQLKILEIPVIMMERQGGVSSISGLFSIYYMAKVSIAIFFTFLKLKSKLWKM